MALQPTYLAESGRPLAADQQTKLLHKIAGSTYESVTTNADLLRDIEYNTRNITVNANSITVDTSTLESLIYDGNTFTSQIDSKTVHVDTNNVTVVSSSLPTGAATEAKQDAGNSTLSTISTNQATAAKQDTGNNTLSSIDTKVATAAKQDTGNSSLSSIDGKITTCNTGAVTVSSSVLPAGAATAGRQDTANTTLGSIDTKITACNTGAVTIAASALPTGASTAARQDTTNAYLSAISLASTPAIGYDAGGRTRVSQLTTLHDGKVTNGHSALLMASAGTGTFTTATDSKTAMSVTSGQYCIYYSKKFLTYLAGKSKMFEATFDTFGPQSNVTKRVGYLSSNAVAPYDSNKDGFWIESGSSTITLNMQRAGTAKINALDITQWSGYANLGAYQTPSNWNNFTVVIFDFLWLGGAMFRLWIKVGTQFVLAHEYHHAGLYADTMIKDPNQTVRYEIRSSTGSGSFNYICSQVATEGSMDNSGCQRSVDSGTSAITCASVGTTYPIKAIRKQSAFRQIPSSLEDFGIFINSTNDLVRYSIEINPTLSAPLTYGNVTNSSLQEATGNGTITVSSRGTVIASGYAYQRLVMPAGLLKENFLSYLGSTIADVMDEYVLCITPVTASVDCFGHMTFKEY